MSVADEPPTRFGVAANPESGETVISVHGDINEGSASELRVILDVEIGQEIVTRLSDGSVRSRVEASHENEEK